MARSSTKTVKGLDGEDTLVFIRPDTKPDSSISGFDLWLCEGYGDSPFVYCCGKNRAIAVQMPTCYPGFVFVLHLSKSGTIDRSVFIEKSISAVYEESVKLIIEEILMRELLEINT